MSGILISLTGNQNMLVLYLHVFCHSMFSLEIFSTHLTYIGFKCLLHMKKHLYGGYTCNFCGTKFKIKWVMEQHLQKSTYIFWFPVKDIKIPHNFYKIQNFLRTSWASVIMHKDLLHLIFWI